MNNCFNDAVPLSDFGFADTGFVPSFRRDDEDFAPYQALIPAPEKNYVFRKENVGIMAAWWEMSSNEPLFISGPHGSGKTSLVREFCARVGCPLISVTARARLDRCDLIGHYVIDRDKSMRFADGPLTRAWRHGFVFLVNEMSAAPPDLWLSVNELLEGSPLYIEATGEVIAKHPRTRIVMTDNLRGLTDEPSGRYLGRFLQDPAVLDRCWKMRVDYMDAASERALLEQTTPDLDIQGMTLKAWKKEFARRLRKTAERIRAAHEHPENGCPTEVTLSTRVLLRFRDLLLLSSQSPRLGASEAIAWAMRIALTESADPASALTIEKLAEAELGDIACKARPTLAVNP